MGNIIIPEFLYTKKKYAEEIELSTFEQRVAQIADRYEKALNAMGLKVRSIDRSGLVLESTLDKNKVFKLTTSDCRAAADALYDLGDTVKFG